MRHNNPPTRRAYRRKVHNLNESIFPFHGRSNTIDTNYYQAKRTKEIKRRKLPTLNNLPKNHVRSLPNIPHVFLCSKKDEDVNTVLVGNRDSLEIEEPSQYHGYDSDGSIAETTIHVSIDKQNSCDKDTRNMSFDAPTCESPTNIEHNPKTSYKSDRKKFLSLDIKSNYDYDHKNTKSTQSKDLDLDEANEDTADVTKNDDEIEKKLIFKMEEAKPVKSLQRRHSDSLVLLKCTPEARDSPEDVKNIFKKMSITSKTDFELFATKSKTDALNEDTVREICRKHGNTVSINEVPTFQEYRSPNSISPQSSLDLSLIKPLPSIIKKARPRSYSLAPTNHLDREFSIMANSVFVALSSPNLGSPRRVLTPVASHPPLDDSHQNSHGAPMVPLSSPDETTACAVHQTRQIMAQRICERYYSNRPKFQPTDKTEKNTYGKPTPRRGSKCSNDYGGRENGRGTSQQQQLDRRESRRGQFTRSLSNADVPPDEKAGNPHIDLLIVTAQYFCYNVANYTFLKDGSLSDTALGGASELEPTNDDVLLKAEPRDYFGPGMGKKSNSTSQLSATGEPRHISHAETHTHTNFSRTYTSRAFLHNAVDEFITVRSR